MPKKRADLTSYARVRNAALRLFGEKGFAATSIRDVAKAAAVSPGLVQHHFPTRQALENAVGLYVRERMTELMQAQPGPGRAPGARSLGPAVVAFIRAHPEIVAYVRRVILEDDRVGRALFDSMVELSRALNQRLKQEGLLRSGLDPVWTPLLTLILVLGPVLLEPALNRYLDQPLRSNTGLVRWDAAIEDLYLHGIYHEGSSAAQPRQKKPRTDVGRPRS